MRLAEVHDTRSSEIAKASSVVLRDPLRQVTSVVLGTADALVLSGKGGGDARVVPSGAAPRSPSEPLINDALNSVDGFFNISLRLSLAAI